MAKSQTPAPASDSMLTWAELGTELQTLEESVQAVRQRYTEVVAAQAEAAQLQAQIPTLSPRSPAAELTSTALQQDLQGAQKRLDELEFILESRLFSWSSLKEPFWQAVRFMGLGIVLGWALTLAIAPLRSGTSPSAPAPAPTLPPPNPDPAQ